MVQSAHGLLNNCNRNAIIHIQEHSSLISCEMICTYSAGKKLLIHQTLILNMQKIKLPTICNWIKKKNK